MITLDDARAHLRIDGTQDDAEIELKLALADAMILAYIGEVAPDSEAATRRQTYEGALDAARLLALGDLWLNREATTGDPLSPAVKNVLQLFREVAYA